MGAAASIPQIYISHIIDITIYFTEIVYQKKKSNNSLNKMYMYIYLENILVLVRFYLFILLNTVIWHGLYDVISVLPEH